MDIDFPHFAAKGMEERRVLWREPFFMTMHNIKAALPNSFHRHEFNHESESVIRELMNFSEDSKMRPSMMFWLA